jgi:hypothetical protein
MRGYNFWTHGVNTIVEFPERASRIVHTGLGTYIEQAESRPNQENNWFHVPLHKPSWIPVQQWKQRADGSYLSEGHCSVEKAQLVGARLKASLNENASIRQIHIRAGDELIHSESVDLRGPTVDHEINISNPVRGYLHTQSNGLVLCVRVVFLSGTPRGQVQFIGAAAYYKPTGPAFPEDWGVDWPGP